MDSVYTYLAFTETLQTNSIVAFPGSFSPIALARKQMQYGVGTDDC